MSEPKKKGPQEISESEKSFSADFQQRMMEQIVKAMQDKHYIEGAFLCWSTIEQTFLPRLILFISKRHKLEINEKWIERNKFGALADFYYCLSHDLVLYNLLKKGAILRNNFTHRMHRTNNFDEVEKNAKAMLLCSVEIYSCCVDRLQGKIQIPSLELYTNGWNDAIEKYRENLINIANGIGNGKYG